MYQILVKMDVTTLREIDDSGAIFKCTNPPAYDETMENLSDTGRRSLCQIYCKNNRSGEGSGNHLQLIIEIDKQVKQTMNSKPRRINKTKVADTMKQVVVASLIGLYVTVVSPYGAIFLVIVGSLQEPSFISVALFITTNLLVSCYIMATMVNSSAYRYYSASCTFSW